MQFLHTLSFVRNSVIPFLSLLLLVSSLNLHAQIIDTAQIESFFNKSWERLYRDPDSASWYLEKGKIESEKGNYFRGIVRYYNFSAALQISRGQNQTALELYEKAVTVAKKYNLDIDLGLTYIKRGTLNQIMGENASAAKSYLAAASIFKTMEDKKHVIGLYSNIISTLNNLQHQNQSLQNVLPALKDKNSSEKEIAAILSQQKTNETELDFPDQTTLRDITGGEIFVIFGGAKFRIASFDILSNYSNFRGVRKIPDGILFRIPDIPRDGTVLRERNDALGRVYLVKDKKRHLVENPDVLDFFGGWDVLYIVPEHSLNQIPDAGDMVTMQNVFTHFNFRKEYEVLIDSLETVLLLNTNLLAEVGNKLEAKNNILQQRKLLRWVFLTGIVALLCIAFLLVRNSSQKQKLHSHSLLTLKKEEEMQRKMALEKERTRIATDMHDDLGAGLTRIKFIAENISEKINDEAMLPEMEKLKITSIELIENMSEIIWAMNDKNNTIEDLLFYLRSYAVDYCNENGLACEFFIPEKIPLKIIGGPVRRNIFLVLKECLHNTVKHARASKVKIDIGVDESLCLTISDNGAGYKQTPDQHGNGLLNIQQRAKELKGKLFINSDAGTVVRLEIPL